jgi:Tfp pilus assembly protein PilN
MINLIPKEEKKKMIIAFYCRLFVLCLIMLSVVVLIASISLLPAYFYSSEKDSVVGEKLQTQKNEETPVLGDQSLSIMGDLNTKLAVVENAEKNKFLISEKVIKAILAKKTSEIKIIQITYKNDPTLGKEINILGTASSRDSLLDFEQTLQNDPAFKNVNLPISSFVRESNIQFDLSLSPA